MCSLQQNERESRVPHPNWHKMGYFGDVSFQATNFTAANNQTHSYRENTHRKLIQTQTSPLQLRNTCQILINWCLQLMTYLLPVEISLHFAKFGTADATAAIYIVACRHCHYLCLGVAIPARVHQQTSTFPVLYVRYQSVRPNTYTDGDENFQRPTFTSLQSTPTTLQACN